MAIRGVTHVREWLNDYILVRLVFGDVVPWSCDYSFVILLNLPTCIRMVRCYFQKKLSEELSRDCKKLSQKLIADVRQPVISCTISDDQMIEGHLCRMRVYRDHQHYGKRASLFFFAAVGRVYPLKQTRESRKRKTTARPVCVSVFRDLTRILKSYLLSDRNH